MSFGEYLREMRELSDYPEARDFSYQAGIHERTFRKYESGERVPPPELLERIVEVGRWSRSSEQRLRRLWNQERAKQLGVTLDGSTDHIDVPALAERIQREVEFELKRGHSTKVSPRTRRVCQRRIEIILNDALGRLKP